MMLPAHKQTEESATGNHLELPARLTNLPNFMKFVQDQAIRLEFPPKRVQEIELVLEEALVNIIKYAYPAGSPESLTIRLAETTDGRLCVEIKDHGIVFNPLTRDAPNVDIELMERPIGGLGILLIKEFTDELTWCRENGNNCLTLIFARRHV